MRPLKLHVMYSGNRRRIVFTISLFLLCLSLIGQNIKEDSSGKYFLKADTTYTDTTIGGKNVVLRNITIYDTVYIIPESTYRPLEIDTYHNQFINPLIDTSLYGSPLKNFWDFEVGFAYGFGIPFQPFIGYHDVLKDIKSMQSFEGFFHGARYFNNWYLKSGLNLSYTQEKQKFSKTTVSVDSTNSYVFTYDSVIIVVDSLLDLNQLPDSVYIVDIDTLEYYLMRDTLYKSQRITKNYEPVNKYFHIGAPLLFGHLFKYKKFDFALEGGFYFNFLVKVNGKSIDYFNDIRQLREKYFYRFSTDLALRFQFRYKLKSLRYVTFTPLVRYNLIDEYSSADFARKKNLSLRFAIGYNFY